LNPNVIGNRFLI